MIEIVIEYEIPNHCQRVTKVSNPAPKAQSMGAKIGNGVLMNASVGIRLWSVYDRDASHYDLPTTHINNTTTIMLA